jgi:hypothetical protein
MSNKTETQKAVEEIELMISIQTKEIKASCKNCHWSGYEKNDFFITCGVHHTNFTSTSFCTDFKEVKA